MGFSSAYQTEAAKRRFSFNYYIEIEGVATRFSKKAITGLASKKLIRSSAWNPPRITLDSARVTIATLTVRLIDPDGDLLTELKNNDVYLKKMSLFLGYDALASGDYHKVAEFRIVKINAGDEMFVINGEDNLGKLREPVKLNTSVLTADLAAGATTLTVISTADFNTADTGKMGDEVLSWTGKTATTLTGLTRGLDGSDDEDHDSGEDVFQVVKIEENPITAMLQLMISPGGGGIYDVLDVGLGIAQADIAVSQFESVRDDSGLAGDEWTIELGQHVDSLLDLFEKEFMLPTTTRLFVDDDALLSLALLDEVTVDSLDDELLKEDVPVVPTPTSDARKLVNRVELKWDFKLGTNKYQRKEEFDDTDSQSRFGTRESRTQSFKFIKQGKSGQAIMERFKDRLFRRASTPIFRLSRMKGLSRKQFFVPGQKVVFIHNKVIDLPLGIKGFNRLIEILSKKWDLEKATVSYEVNASELLSERYGFISAASDVVSGASDTVFTLAAGEGVKWKVGYEVSIWLKSGGTGPIGTASITIIATDTITVDASIGVTPSSIHQLRFADFPSVTETVLDQKRFGWITDDSNPFGDGSDPYLIQ